MSQKSAAAITYKIVLLIAGGRSKVCWVKNDKNSLSRMENIGEMVLYVNRKVSTAYAVIGLGCGERACEGCQGQTWIPNLYPKLNPRKRGAIRATLQTPGGPIYFFNTHLSLYKLERRRQLKALLDKKWLSSVSEDEPVIFCGDLNAGALSKTYRKLARHFVDVQRALDDPLLPKPTFHSKSPLFRIDHMFISKYLTPLKVEVPINTDTQMASDHLPLIAELAVRNNKS